MTTSREYRLTITDRDGEENIYDFRASHPWEVGEYVWTQFRKKGDFYGHCYMETMILEIAELIIGTVTMDVIDLSVQRKL